MTPVPPPSLPRYIFLLSDHTTRQLACDVAEELAKLSPAVYIEDFLAPIHDGLSAMLDLDIKRDMGSPSNTNRLVVECEQESTEGDLIISLEKWFSETFGEKYLGERAFRHTQNLLTMFDYSFVFRDAAPIDIKPFLEKINWREMLFVQFPCSYIWPNSIPKPEAIWIASQNNVNDMVRAILEHK